MARPLSRYAGLVLSRAAVLTALLAVVFVAVEVLPGDAATSTVDRGTSAADLAARRAELGLDEPVLLRFAHWLGGLVTGDLGTSARGEPVAGLVAAQFSPTLVLGGTALLLTAVSSLLLGGWATMRPHGAVDRVVTTVSTVVLALPEFVVAGVLLLVFALGLGLLPAATVTDADGAPASPAMLVLPVLALAIPQIGWNTRLVRAALADEAAAPHVESATLDGLSRHRILLRHVLPGALPTIATGLATSTGMLLGGAVVVETVFNHPGLGAVLAAAVADRDTPVVAAAVALSGAAVAAVLLLADLTRVWAAGDRA
jgi:peptide/nickel transport system permease protein